LKHHWHNWPNHGNSKKQMAAFQPTQSGRLDFISQVWGDGNFALRNYQHESMVDPALRKLHQDGRDVGKTTEIEICMLHFALTQSGKECLLATQWQNNLAPTLERIIRTCQNHPQVAPRVRRITRSPFTRIEFVNGSLLMGKIAGNRGVNFQNTHVDFIAVDEAQNMLDCGWDELFPALNAGGMFYIYGVPNGLRNRYYQLSSDSGFKQYRWPSSLHPDFDEAKDEELARLYGGRDTPGYIHNVLGEHGSPAGSVFQFNHLERCVLPHSELYLQLTGDNPQSNDKLGRWLASMELADDRILLGMDVGYSQDPSVVSVWAVGGTDMDNWRLRSCGVLSMERIPYREQESILSRIMQQTSTEALACDRGGGGLAVLQSLAAGNSELASRITRAEDGELGVPFGGRLTLRQGGIETRHPIKRATTDLYVRLIQERRVRFGNGARLEQLAGHTYSLSPRGEVLYSKGNDHIIDADRAMLFELMSEKSNAGGSYYSPRLDEI
jgi:hypothetical protein